MLKEKFLKIKKCVCNQHKWIRSERRRETESERESKF